MKSDLICNEAETSFIKIPTCSLLNEITAHWSFCLLLQKQKQDSTLQWWNGHSSVPSEAHYNLTVRYGRSSSDNVFCMLIVTHEDEGRYLEALLDNSICKCQCGIARTKQCNLPATFSILEDECLIIKTTQDRGRLEAGQGLGNGRRGGMGICGQYVK